MRVTSSALCFLFAFLKQLTFLAVFISLDTVIDSTFDLQKLRYDYLLFSYILVTLLQISCVDVSNDTGKIAVAYENKVR